MYNIFIDRNRTTLYFSSGDNLKLCLCKQLLALFIMNTFSHIR